MDDAAIADIASPYTPQMAQLTQTPDAGLRGEAQFLQALRAGRRRLAAVTVSARQAFGARTIVLEPAGPASGGPRVAA